MHDAPPFQPKRHRRSEAESVGPGWLMAAFDCVPDGCDKRVVIYGNFGDVITWEGVCDLYEQHLDKKAGCQKGNL